MSVSTHIAPGRLSRAVDRALINRPMVADDVPWAVNHHLTAAMRTFVEECAQRDVPFWNGKLSNNTFNTAGNRFKTFNWYRLWEYASCYDLLIQAFAPGARFVDVNSGLESAPGVKDRTKLKDFVAALHQAGEERLKRPPS